MSRPEHLNVVNTPEGIRRINQLQESYDSDPEAYERREREERELRLAMDEEDAKERARYMEDPNY